MNKRNMIFVALLLSVSSSWVYGMNSKKDWVKRAKLDQYDTENLYAFINTQSFLDKLRKERKRRTLTEAEKAKKNSLFPSMPIRLYYENCQICNQEFVKKFAQNPHGKIALASCGHCYCDDEIKAANALWKKELEEKMKREKKQRADYSDYESKCPVQNCNAISERLVVDTYGNLADGTKINPHVLQALRGLRGNNPRLIYPEEINLYKSNQRIEQLSKMETSLDKELMNKMLYHLDVLAQHLLFSKLKEEEYRKQNKNFNPKKDAGDIYYIDLIHKDVCTALKKSRIPQNPITQAVLALILLSAKYNSPQIKEWKKTLDNPERFGVGSLIICSYLRYMFAIKNPQEAFAQIKLFYNTMLSLNVEISNDSFENLYDSGRFRKDRDKKEKKEQTPLDFSSMYNTQYFG